MLQRLCRLHEAMSDVFLLHRLNGKISIVEVCERKFDCDKGMIEEGIHTRYLQARAQRSQRTVSST
jgi:hypothetical protein